MKVNFFTNMEVPLSQFQKILEMFFEWQLTKLFCSITFGGSVNNAILKFCLLQKES